MNYSGPWKCTKCGKIFESNVLIAAAQGQPGKEPIYLCLDCHSSEQHIDAAQDSGGRPAQATNIVSHEMPDFEEVKKHVSSKFPHRFIGDNHEAVIKFTHEFIARHFGQ